MRAAYNFVSGAQTNDATYFVIRCLLVSLRGDYHSGNVASCEKHEKVEMEKWFIFGINALRFYHDVYTINQLTLETI